MLKLTFRKFEKDGTPDNKVILDNIQFFSSEGSAALKGTFENVCE